MNINSKLTAVVLSASVSVSGLIHASKTDSEPNTPPQNTSSQVSLNFSVEEDDEKPPFSRIINIPHNFSLDVEQHSVKENGMVKAIRDGEIRMITADKAQHMVTHGEWAIIK